MGKTIVAILLCAMLGAVPGSFGWAGPAGTAFTYQGRLQDAGGPAEGPYDFQFKLYDQPVGPGEIGVPVTIADQPVSNGYFTVQLDFGSSVFTGDARWLEIGVRPGAQSDPDPYTTLAPRQELTPIPYALYAAHGPGSAGFWAAGADHIYNTNSGNVGIGTSTPAWELEVANLNPGDGAESAVSADDAGGAIAAYSSSLGVPYEHFAGRVSLFANMITGGLDLRADGGAADMRFYTGGLWPFNEKMRIASTGGVRLTSYLDDGLGSWEQGFFFVNNSNGMGPWSHAGIWSDGVSGFNGELVFGVDSDDTNNLTGIQEVMRISRFGSLGIGTKYPGQKLHVNNSSAASGGVARFSNNQGTYLDIGVAGSSAGWPVGDDTPYLFTENTNLIILTGSGNVGIGTADPQTALEVAGTTRTSVLQISGGSDLAESFDLSEQTMKARPGMLVCIDAEHPGQLNVSRTAYDRTVAGIISGANGINTGMMMGQGGTPADGGQPVALTGRVYCWADASNGSIQPGDLLTTSTVPGHAMKVTDHDRAPGAVVGKAMTPLASGRGMVLVLVSLQ